MKRLSRWYSVTIIFRIVHFKICKSDGKGIDQLVAFGSGSNSFCYNLHSVGTKSKVNITDMLEADYINSFFFQTL